MPLTSTPHHHHHYHRHRTIRFGILQQWKTKSMWTIINKIVAKPQQPWRQRERKKKQQSNGDFPWAQIFHDNLPQAHAPAPFSFTVVSLNCYLIIESNQKKSKQEKAERNGKNEHGMIDESNEESCLLWSLILSLTAVWYMTSEAWAHITFYIMHFCSVSFWDLLLVNYHHIFDFSIIVGLNVYHFFFGKKSFWYAYNYCQAYKTNQIMKNYNAMHRHDTRSVKLSISHICGCLLFMLQLRK